MALCPLLVCGHVVQAAQVSWHICRRGLGTWKEIDAGVNKPLWYELWLRDDLHLQHRARLRGLLRRCGGEAGLARLCRAPWGSGGRYGGGRFRRRWLTTGATGNYGEIRRDDSQNRYDKAQNGNPLRSRKTPPPGAHPSLQQDEHDSYPEKASDKTDIIVRIFNQPTRSNR
jgi:hypothetical protein